MQSLKKLCMTALVFTLVCLSVGYAYAGIDDAICRIVVKGDNVSLRQTPSPNGQERFKASAKAEYIASRYTTACAGIECDGSLWYELPGMISFEDESIAPSLEGRSAKGALLYAPLYISAKDVQEIPLREGDAEAVHQMLENKFKKDDEFYFTIMKIISALNKHVGRSSLEAKSKYNNAVVLGILDSDDDEEFAHTYVVHTDTSYVIYISDAPLSIYLAEKGANIGGIILGKSSMDEVRAIFGVTGDEYDVDEELQNGFTFTKYNLKGGVPVYEEEGAQIEHTIPFKAVKQIVFEWTSEEGMGEGVVVYFDDSGCAVAMHKYSFGWR